MTTINPSQSTASYESIKLGIDAHAKYCWVSRQVEPKTSGVRSVRSLQLTS